MNEKTFMAFRYGKYRECVNRYCLFCKKVFYFPVCRIGKWSGKYCSSKCKVEGRKTRKEVPCFLCKKITLKKISSIKKTKFLFCSRRCKEQAQKFDVGILKANSKTGKFSYRKRALDYHGAKCSKCGYSKIEKMLDVDHISSDRKDNRINNLQVLCVWCHALKTRKIKGPVV